MRRARAVPLLVLMVAVLLPAAVLAAVRVDGPVSTLSAGDDRLGTAGLGGAALLEAEAAARSAAEAAGPLPEGSAVTSSVPPPPPPSRPGSTTTPPGVRPTAGGTGSPTATLPPGVPAPTGPPPTGIPNVSPASAWSGDRDGVSARMRIDPPAPVAGQSVRFLLDFSSAEPCCTVLLDFGDGSGGFSLNNDRSCGTSPPLTAGPQRATAGHVYANPGAYKASLVVFAGDSCSQPPLAPGSPPPMPVIHSVSFDACLAVGPGTAGQSGCSPFPDFGPDSMISPVLDPFCQVRSDCTKASPPR